MIYALRSSMYLISNTKITVFANILQRTDTLYGVWILADMENLENTKTDGKSQHNMLQKMKFMLSKKSVGYRV